MSNLKAELITIGDEILYGQIVDTNSQWMSAALDEIGVKTVRKTTIGDQENEILTALKEAEQRADIILITGGLGPTKDDITKPCLAKYFNNPLEINQIALKELTELFKKFDKELTNLNRKQAELPVNAEMISNKLGSAAGMWFHERNKVFVSMPGVPYEMKNMMTETVIPKIKEIFPTQQIHHRIIRTIGIGESWLSEIIEEWEDNLPSNMGLAYLPGIGEVKLRVTATGHDVTKLRDTVNEQINKVLPLINEYVYGYDQTTLESAVGNLLIEKNLTISTAESCTGGYLAHQLTSVPGSSAYFMGSIIAYDNAVKINQLSVSEEIIQQYGAVSEETVGQMAINVRKSLNTDIGVATSGIAGPGGGTKEKPVGTIWIAYACKDKCVTKKLSLVKSRILNIKYTSVNLLNLIRTETI